MACLLLAIPAFLFATVGKSSDKLAFARVLSDREVLVEGDSCLINVALFSYYPFELLERPKPLSVKNGELRRLPLGRYQLQRVKEEGRIYYVKIVDQYILKASNVGEITIPQRGLKMVMEVPVRSADPLEELFGIRVPVKRMEAKVKMEEWHLKVKSKPQRTMLEMHNSGLQVL